MKTLKQRIEGMLFREMEFRADGIVDEGERIIRVVASTETPVLRRSFFAAPWLETLGHKRGEVDLDRLKKGAPVLYNHNMFSRADRIGVVESAKLNGKERRIEATIRLSKRDDVDDIWTDVRDGILKNISVGYTINERTLTREGKGEPDEFRITSWSPGEISLVPLGADMNAQVGARLGDAMEYRVFDIETERSDNEMFTYDKDGNPLGDTPETRAAILAGTATRKDGSPYVPTDDVRAALIALDKPAPAAPAPAAVIPIDADAAHAEGVAEGRKAEQQRVADINALFVPFNGDHDAVRTAAIAKSDQTVEQTRALLLDSLGKDSAPAGGDSRIELSDDATDKFIRAANMSIAVRGGFATPEERTEVIQTGFRGFTLYDLARRALEMSGQNADRFGKLELVGRAFTTSDFPLLLADAANKSMLRGWDEAEETWATWMNTGSLSDFKVGNLVNLSSFENLTQVNENGEYTFGAFQEEGQTIQLATYGKMFGISRQAIINDDLNAFTRIPSAMGRAASRTVGDIAYGVLTANGLIGDGVALFDAAHNNLNESGAGGTPLTQDAAGVAALSAMDVAMGTQTDVSGNATALNIDPSFLIVPRVLKRIAVSLMSDTTAPGQANPGVSNQVANLAQVVSDARLDADSVTRYYLAARGDTIQVAFLDGNQAPMLEQQAGWSIDGTEYKVRIDAAAAAEDFRGLQRDDGA